MDELIVPLALAGGGVDGEEAIGKKILANSVRTPEIKRRRTDGDVYDPTLFIQRHAAPTIHATDEFPSVRWPGFVAEIARLWNGSKGPNRFSGSNVVSSHVSGC